MLCYKNTIGDKRNEMDFFYHCQKVDYNHELSKFFEKLTMHYWDTKFQVVMYIYMR